MRKPEVLNVVWMFDGVVIAVVLFGMRVLFGCVKEGRGFACWGILQTITFCFL